MNVEINKRKPHLGVPFEFFTPTDPGPALATVEGGFDLSIGVTMPGGGAGRGASAVTVHMYLTDQGTARLIAFYAPAESRGQRDNAEELVGLFVSAMRAVPA